MKKRIRTTAATMKSIMNRWCIERVCELLGSEASRRHYLDIFLMYEITKVCLFSDISNTAKNEIEMDVGKVNSGQVRSGKVNMDIGETPKIPVESEK